MKKRLEFISHTSSVTKERYANTVQNLRSQINTLQPKQINYLNQEITRKKLSLAKNEAKIKRLRIEFSNKHLVQELAAMRVKYKNMKRRNTRLKETKDCGVSTSNEILKLKYQVKLKNHAIGDLQNDKLCLEEKVTMLESGESSLQKSGKTFPLDMRMFVYDAIVCHVPTKSVPVIIEKYAKRTGIILNQVPHRSTVEMMTRELGVILDFRAAEILIDTDDLTLGFDATTQEGLHINSIHVTSNDDCHVLAIDQLAGGTAEDYENHITESIDCLTEVYCKFYSTNFEDNRKKIIGHISNTMTDRATVNHATIQRLELNWRKRLNELNCHLHPLDTIASSVRTALKANEPPDLVKKLYSNDCISHALVLGINKFRYKDGRGDPKGFNSSLESAGLPKGLLPRYRGNRLHIMFHIAGKLHHHRVFFMNLFEETTVTCGGLQTAILHDYRSTTAQVELHVLGLLGKLLSGPWMVKFYTSSATQISHIDGIAIVRELLRVIVHFIEKLQETLSSKTDFFGNPLSVSDDTLVALQQKPVDKLFFNTMMGSCLSKVIEVVERQYAHYFTTDLTDQLRKETETARCHNIDAEEIMGMFSAAKEHAPNATMCYLSSRIRAQKNNIVTYLDDMPTEKRQKLIELAINLGRKQRLSKRKRTENIKTAIAKRLADKLQKRKTTERNRLEKKLKSCDSELDITAQFGDLEESVLQDVVCIMTGKIVGHQLCHVWYDGDTQGKTMYCGKVEKLLKKGGGTYRIGYWQEGETYENDAEDFDISKYAIAADLICEDLTLS